jgi:hypothetical protein
VSSDYYSSTSSFHFDPSSSSRSAERSAATARSGHRPPSARNNFPGPGARKSTSASNLCQVDLDFAAAAPAISHSYHSSVSSNSSASSDREELLHLQHSLAREVRDKSRLVAVRALTSSPGQLLPHRYSPLRPPSPPSPTQLPTVQQREGFFT